MQADTGQRLRSIDFLRGCAALGVVGAHAMAYGDRYPTDAAWFRFLAEVFEHGLLGVPLFFVISGFCIHLRWAQRRAGTGQTAYDFGAFWRRRLRRLYPPYLVALLISMGLVLAAYLLGRQVPVLTRYPDPRLPWMGIDFLAHLGMLHGLHPVLDRAGGNPVYWTLAREEYLYLLYLPLLAWRRWWGPAAALALVTVSGLLFPYLLLPFLPPRSPWWEVVTSSALVLWVQWCLGMVAAEAHCGLIRLPSWCSRLWLVPLWGALAETSPWFAPQLTPVFWGLTFFTLVNYCAGRERDGLWAGRGLTGWVTRTGLISYSLYLIHNPARAVLKQLLGPLRAPSDPLLYLLVAAGVGVACYYAGKAFFAVVERPFLPTSHLAAVQTAGRPDEA